MNRSLFIALSLFLLPQSGFSFFEEIPDLDLEASSPEYARALDQVARVQPNHIFSLEQILTLGKRNLDWLSFINQNRSAKISFSDASTQGGYPPETPHIYNQEIILNKFNQMLKELPAAMKTVLQDGGNFTKEPPLEISEYKSWGIKIDRIYQGAARWNLMEPFLWSLAARKSGDLRGFYFLNNSPTRKETLANFSRLDSAQQSQIKEWLSQMCANNSITDCSQRINQSIRDNSLEQLFQGLLPRSQRMWNNYFKISATYSEAKRINENLFVVNFRNTNDPLKNEFIQKNIMDEWRWGNWHLETRLGNSGVQVKWEPGITPHVPALGAGEIYMDANQPLTEYDAQWTIRHEFGHVLGFEDCYIEFYDSQIRAIVAYQLDISNLMCSRRGHIKQIHLDLLNQKYATAFP